MYTPFPVPSSAPRLPPAAAACVFADVARFARSSPGSARRASRRALPAFSPRGDARLRDSKFVRFGDVHHPRRRARASARVRADGDVEGNVRRPTPRRPRRPTRSSAPRTIERPRRRFARRVEASRARPNRPTRRRRPAVVLMDAVAPPNANARAMTHGVASAASSHVAGATVIVATRVSGCTRASAKSISAGASTSASSRGRRMTNARVPGRRPPRERRDTPRGEAPPRAPPRTSKTALEVDFSSTSRGTAARWRRARSSRTPSRGSRRRTRRGSTRLRDAARMFPRSPPRGCTRPRRLRRRPRRAPPPSLPTRRLASRARTRIDRRRGREDASPRAASRAWFVPTRVRSRAPRIESDRRAHRRGEVLARLIGVTRATRRQSRRRSRRRIPPASHENHTCSSTKPAEVYTRRTCSTPPRARATSPPDRPGDTRVRALARGVSRLAFQSGEARSRDAKSEQPSRRRWGRFFGTLRFGRFGDSRF